MRSATVTETIIEWTVGLTAERRAFGESITDFQNTQFVLADLKARAVTARVFADKCIELFMRGGRSGRRGNGQDGHHGTTLRGGRQVPQLFGGWGYMWEYPIARAYADARIVKIAGGSIEVMKTIISRDMFKGRVGPQTNELTKLIAKHGNRDNPEEVPSGVLPVQKNLDANLRFGFLIHDVSRLRRIVVDPRAETAGHHPLAMVGAGLPLAPRWHDADRACRRS